MRYQKESPGCWGATCEDVSIKTGTEQVAMRDGCHIFTRYWRTGSQDVLLVLHGLGGHSGWYIDLGNEIARHDINVYIMDHRGFGRSEGLAGHIDAYDIYIADIVEVVQDIRRRHPDARITVLGHSMGALFAAHFAARHQRMIEKVIFLNPWIQDTAKTPISDVVRIFAGGVRKSKRTWQVGNGHHGMTTNTEAIQMLSEDTFWRKHLTATFLFQIFLMRLATLKVAKRITIPALVIQAEADTVVLPTASRKLYDALASTQKSWISYPDYHHDSQFEHERSMLDEGIVTWVKTHREPVV